MKWFKHFSDASNDEFISDLEEEFGLAGYARWWKLLEAIANQMEAGSSKCSASYSEKKWCRKLQCKPKVLRRFLEVTDNEKKTRSEQNGNIIEIFCPKLLKLRDNYSTNLQVKDKPLASKEVEVEEEVEKDIVTKEKPVNNGKNIYGQLDNVMLSIKEFDKLTDDLTTPVLCDYIERLSLYIPNKKPPAYKDHNAVIRSWWNKDKKDGKVKSQPQRQIVDDAYLREQGLLP